MTKVADTELANDKTASNQPNSSKVKSPDAAYQSDNQTQQTHNIAEHLQQAEKFNDITQVYKNALV